MNPLLICRNFRSNEWHQKMYHKVSWDYPFKAIGFCSFNGTAFLVFVTCNLVRYQPYSIIHWTAFLLVNKKIITKFAVFFCFQLQSFGRSWPLPTSNLSHEPRPLLWCSVSSGKFSAMTVTAHYRPYFNKWSRKIRNIIRNGCKSVHQSQRGPWLKKTK
jgi:hypothetical protein